MNFKKSFLGSLSPKIGATYKISSSLNGFISYRQAFRAPSESQLFRQGKAINTVDLKPITCSTWRILYSL